MRDKIEQHFNTFYKYIGIFDIAAGMDMQVSDMNIVLLYYREYLIQLLNRDTKLTFIVTGGDLQITSRYDIRAKSYTDRVIVTIFLSKLFQVGQAVNIDIQAKAYRFFDLIKADTIGSV